MRVSELIEELTKHAEEWGDCQVVLHDGLGAKVGWVFWDKDGNGETVIAVGG